MGGSDLYSFILLFIIFTCPLVLRAKVYEFKGDPYHGGDLPVRYANLASYKELPLYTLLFYPLEPGEYVPIVFIPGLDGTVPPNFYSDTLGHLASHGYVIITMDTVVPLVGNGKLHKDEFLAKRVYEEVIWLQSNLAQQVLPSLVDNVTVDWSLLGLAAHSAGGDTILQLLQNRTLGAKAVAFMEPFSFNFRKPLGYSIPALSYGTELCEEEPNCCVPGIDYRHFYDMLDCPRVLMNVTDYGHCAILNDIGWKSLTQVISHTCHSLS
ncbi:uncharacterized protein [Dysidea avara]|uniref:uncharacterized protein isoform X2 n=1 Tax=Dysidea avara TaxID=196820 RepID=UPI003331B925